MQEDRHRVRLYLDIPDNLDPREQQHLGFLTIHHVLGEFVAMMKIGAYAVAPLDSAPEEAQPLAELKTAFGVKD